MVLSIQPRPTDSHKDHFERTMSRGLSLEFVTPTVHDTAYGDVITTLFSESTAVLPAELEAIEPGLRLAALLAGVDRSRLSDHDVVRLMVARDRLVSHDQAERAADIAEVTRRCGDDDLTGEFAALEVGAALRLTSTAAQHEVAFAHEVTERLPRSR